MNKTIETNQGQITVYELGLKDYVELIKRLKKVVPTLTDIYKDIDVTGDKKAASQKASEALIGALPDLIVTALPEVTFLLALVTKSKPEDYDEASLATTIKIVDAGLEVNEIDFVVDTIKKMIARNSKPQPEPQA